MKVLLDVSKKYLNINFLIIGNGSGLLSLKKYVKKYQLNNVIFKNKMEWEELIPYYANSSILYAQLDGKEYEIALPSKLYEYASVGLPIIYGGIGYAKSFVEKLENSKVVKPNSVKDLELAIESIQNYEISISQKNRLLIKKYYIRENISKKLSLIINKVLGARQDEL